MKIYPRSMVGSREGAADIEGVSTLYSSQQSQLIGTDCYFVGYRTFDSLLLCVSGQTGALLRAKIIEGGVEK